MSFADDMFGMMQPGEDRDRIEAHVDSLRETANTSIDGPIDPESLLDVTVNRPRGSYLIGPGETYGEDDEYTNEGDTYLIAIHARQGGGNDECWCDDPGDDHEDGCLRLNNDIIRDEDTYLADFYDSFDSTYITFIHDAGVTKETVDKLAANSRALGEKNQAKLAVDMMEAGYITPWGAAENASVARQFHDKWGMASGRSDKERIDKLTKNVTVLGEFIGKIDTGDIDDIEFPEFFSLSILGNRTETIDSSIVRSVNDAQKAKIKGDQAEAAMKEAEALPDGPLKEMLLGDRGMGSYMTKERRGRRKVEVRKTFQRGSFLGSEVNSKIDLRDNRLKSLKTTNFRLDKLRDILAQSEEQLSKAKDAFIEADRLRDEAWEYGWPVDAGELPDTPDWFLSDNK